jgi:NADH-quinone oxidoreductase subunit C
VESIEQIKTRIEIAIPGAQLQIVPNGSQANQPSLRVNPAQMVAVAMWLRQDPQLQLDYASNVTGIDWPDKKISEKIRVKRSYKGQEIEVDEIQERLQPGFLEVVYHLYSMALKHGPVILRLQTENRTDRTHLPSLIGVYRGAEFQEREVFDLFGIVFDGHPDLRRLLMWEEFTDYPLRKDYQEPDDYQYEPTPHGSVLEKARRYYPPEVSHG